MGMREFFFGPERTSFPFWELPQSRSARQLWALIPSYNGYMRMKWYILIYKP